MWDFVDFSSFEMKGSLPFWNTCPFLMHHVKWLHLPSCSASCPRCSKFSVVSRPLRESGLSSFFLSWVFTEKPSNTYVGDVLFYPLLSVLGSWYCIASMLEILGAYSAHEATPAGRSVLDRLEPAVEELTSLHCWIAVWCLNQIDSLETTPSLKYRWCKQLTTAYLSL